MPIGTSRMPFLEHLVELRRRLIIIIISLFVVAIGMYYVSPFLIKLIIHPIVKLLPNGNTLNELGPLSPFVIRFRVALYAAFVVASPIIIWQVFGFFLPGMKEKERKWVVPTFLAAVSLFVLGNVFCYLFALYPAYEWMFAQGGGVIEIIPQATPLLNSIIFLLIGFGVVFEVPLVVFYLIILNVVKYEVFRKNWRVIYIVLLTVAAVTTPDASPVTMAIMSAALIVLYEASLFLSYVVTGKRRKEKKLAELRAEIDEEEESY